MGKDIINWVVNNWLVSLLMIIGVGISAYDLAARYISLAPPVDPALKIDLILFLLVAYVLNATLRFNDMNRLLRKRLHFRRGSSSFIETMHAHVTDLEKGLENQKLEISNRHQTMAVLLTMIDKADKSYEGLNFYIGGWKTEMREFYEANVGAARRGVQVTRYFIIQDEHDSPEALQQLLDEMREQAISGIEVYFALERDIRTISYFRNNPIRGIGLLDEEILVIDTSPARRSSGPVEIVVIWDPDEVRAKNPFPQLKRHKIIRSYSDCADELEKLLEDKESS